MKPCIERLELIDFLAHSLGHPGRPALPRSRDVVGEQPEHALLPETAYQPPHGIGMGVRVLRPLHGCSIGQEDEGADSRTAIGPDPRSPTEVGQTRPSDSWNPLSLCSCGGRGFMYHTRGRLSLRNERRAMAQGMVRGGSLNSPYMSRKSWRGSPPPVEYDRQGVFLCYAPVLMMPPPMEYQRPRHLARGFFSSYPVSTPLPCAGWNLARRHPSGRLSASCQRGGA